MASHTSPSHQVESILAGGRLNDFILQPVNHADRVSYNGLPLHNQRPLILSYV